MEDAIKKQRESDEYFDDLKRKADEVDLANRVEAQIIVTAEATQKATEQLNTTAEEWSRQDLKVDQKVIDQGRDALQTLEQNRAAEKEPGAINAGDTVQASFPNPNSTVAVAFTDNPAQLRGHEQADKETQEVYVEKSVRLDEQQWNQLNSDSNSYADGLKSHLEGVNKSAEDKNAVAFSPPVGTQGSPVVVIPNTSGGVKSFGVDAVKQPAQELQQGQAKPEVSTAEPQAKPAPAPSLNQSTSEKTDSPKLAASPNNYSAGNRWGADNKIADSWEKHEQAQKELKSKIDSQERTVEAMKARGEDTSKEEIKLKMSQNQYAINQHDQAARSWSNTATFAKSTHIGGACDTQSLRKAEGMRDQHRAASQQLQEQQAKLKQELEGQTQAKAQNEQNAQQATETQAKSQGQITANAQATGQAPAQAQGNQPEQVQAGSTPAQRSVTADTSSQVKASNQQQPHQQPQQAATQKPEQSQDKEKSTEQKKEKEPSKAYDPNDRVKAMEAQGKANKEESEAKGKQTTADNTKALDEQNKKAQECKQEQSNQQQQDQNKGKQMAR